MLQETALKKPANDDVASTAMHSRFPCTPDLEQLTNGQWRQYRKSLSPRYTIVWRDIALFYVLLISGIAAAWIASPSLSITARLVVVLPLAIWIAYWLHAIGSFMHEAAHFHIHPDKRVNDKLADWLVCSFMGQAVGKYRKSHWQHHLHLGEAGDTEITYLKAPTWVFIISTLTGWHVVRVLLSWRKAKPQTHSEPRSLSSLAPLARFGAIQLIVLGTCLYTGRWEIALSWMGGMFAFFPALASMQNILEHRGMNGDIATNRMFGNGWLPRSFGAAGFNRHLLHHWDPQISYTRFDDMEAFLMQTPAAALLDKGRTTYIAALRQLRQTA